MGTWGVGPVGNDTAADFTWELDGQRRWTVVERALAEVSNPRSLVDEDEAARIAIAAAEVVAHGLGRPTQDDAYTTSIRAFVARARRPGRRLARRASRAVVIAASADGELGGLWAEAGADEWYEAVARLLDALDVS